MINIGEHVYFTWSQWEGSILASVRQFYLNKKGDLSPGRNEISFTQKYYDNFKNLLSSLVLVKEAAPFNLGFTQPGLALEGLAGKVAERVYEFVAATRYASCNPCHGLRGDHSRVVERERKPAGTELLAALEKAKKHKMVEAVLMHPRNVSCNQLLTLDASKYLEENKQAILQRVDELFSNTKMFHGVKFPFTVLRD